MCKWFEHPSASTGGKRNLVLNPRVHDAFDGQDRRPSRLHHKSAFQPMATTLTSQFPPKMSQKKRAHASESPSPSPARTDDHSGPKRPKEAFNTPRPLRALKIHIIKAKLDPSTIAELVNQAENEGAIVCADPRDAEVLVTNVGMRKRLERHVPWAVAVSRSTCIRAFY